MKNTLKILPLLGALLIGVNGFAQPSNDDAANALELTDLNDFCSDLDVYTTVGATVDGPPLPLGSARGNVWFKFTATGPLIAFQVKRSGTSGQFFKTGIWTADLNTSVAYTSFGGSVSERGVVATNLIAGQDYLISVDTRVIGDAGSFGLCITDNPEFYWVSGPASVFSDAANWGYLPAVSGAVTGVGVPGSNDKIVFAASPDGQCTFDVPVDVKGIETQVGYNGRLNQTAGLPITVGTDGWTQGAANFVGISGDITIAGDLIVNAGVWRASSSENTINGNHITTAGIFQHNNGLMRYEGMLTISGNHLYHDLELTAESTPSNIELDGQSYTVGGTFSTTGTQDLSLNLGSILTEEDILLNNSGSGTSGSANVVLSGSQNQQITGSSTGVNILPGNLELNKTGGTVTLIDQIGITGNWNNVTGTLNAGTSTVHFLSNHTIIGSMSLSDVVLGGSATPDLYNLTLSGSTLTVNNLTYGSGSYLIDGGTIAINQNLNLSAATLNGGGTGAILLNGTTDQAITSPTNLNILPNLMVNKPSGNVLLSGDLQIAANLTLTSGNINTNSTDQVIFEEGSTAGGSASSFINGPARKDGGGCFMFPLGKGNTYAPVLIAGGSASDEVTAEYFGQNQTFGTNLGTGLQNLSTCEHWTVSRTDLTNNLQVGVSYGSTSCNIPATLEDYRIVGWNGNQWADHGGLIMGDATGGIVESTNAITTFTAFTTAQAGAPDPNLTAWTGATSTDWFDAANWTNDVPRQNKPAVIGDENFTGSFSPVIVGTRTAVARQLCLGEGATPVTLTLDGKTLKVKGDLTIGANGTLTVTTSENPRRIRLEGSWVMGGTFNPGEGKVILQKAIAPQVITASNFYNLDLKAQNGHTISVAGDLDIVNNIHLKEGAVRGDNYTISFGGKWRNTTATFDPGFSTVIATAANTPNDVGRIQSENFFNLIINAPGRKIKPVAEAIINIANTFDIQNGEFDHKQDALNACTVEGIGTNNRLLLAAGATLVNRQPTFTDKYPGWETIVLDEASTVRYHGKNAPQTIASSIQYGNLHVKGNDLKQLDGNTLVRRNLTNEGSGANDIDFTTSNHNLQVNGDLELNNATLIAQGGSFALQGNWISGKYQATEGALVGFTGSSANQIISEPNLNFVSVALAKPSGTVTLAQPITVTASMAFNQGVLQTTATNIITYEDGVTLAGGNNQSFVNGPIRKVGDDAFTFPTGYLSGGSSRISPVRISAPATINSSILAEYKLQGQAFGSTLDDELESISTCDFWEISSEGSAEDLEVWIGWDDDFCPISNPERASIVAWNGNVWENIGVDVVEYGDKGTGANLGILKGGNLSLALNGTKPVLSGTLTATDNPYAQLKKRLDGGFYQVIDGQLNFRYEEEYNDQDQSIAYRVLDERNTELYTNLDQPLTALYGDNWRTLDVSCNGSGLNQGIYILEVTNEKNETFYLRFKQLKNFICGQIPDFTLTLN